MKRELNDWVRGFAAFAKPFNSGDLFKEWVGVWQLGTAATRSVGMRIRGQFLAPNMYVMLVAGPGAGKSQAIAAARPILIPATGFSLIPAQITRAGLIDYMKDNMKQRVAPDGMTVVSNECIALSDEINGILPENDVSHLTLYNELWDNKNMYKSRTRTSGEFNLQRPYCSIITGTQPAYLAQMLPEQAWGMGFMRRAIMIFDTPGERSDAFEVQDVDFALQTKLITDLKQIRGLHGFFNWQDEAKQLYREWWVKTGGAPIPSAKRLAMGYNSSRDMSFFKLSMIFSLSRSSDLQVTLGDAARAIELLTRTEDRMRHIFAEMASTGAIAAYGDVIDAIRARVALGDTMPEADLVFMLQDRFQPSQVASMIENLLASGVIDLKPGAITGRGIRTFIPGPKLGGM